MHRHPSFLSIDCLQESPPIRSTSYLSAHVVSSWSAVQDTWPNVTYRDLTAKSSLLALVTEILRAIRPTRPTRPISLPEMLHLCGHHIHVDSCKLLLCHTIEMFRRRRELVPLTPLKRVEHVRYSSTMARKCNVYHVYYCLTSKRLVLPMGQPPPVIDYFDAASAAADVELDSVSTREVRPSRHQRHSGRTVEDLVVVAQVEVEAVHNLGACIVGGSVTGVTAVLEPRTRIESEPEQSIAVEQVETLRSDKILVGGWSWTGMHLETVT